MKSAIYTIAMDVDPTDNKPSIEPARREFQVDTYTIPASVDLELAGKRNRIIHAFRAGEKDAATTLRELLDLYWQHAPYDDGGTGHYLMKIAYEFPFEAGMSVDEADEIYIAAQEAHT